MQKNNIFHNTRTGTPQGGIISPLLANIALHGLDEALNIKYKCKSKTKGYFTNNSQYSMVQIC